MEVSSRAAGVYVFDVTVVSVGRVSGLSLRRQFSVFVRLQGQGMRTTWVKSRDDHVDYNERFRFRYQPRAATSANAQKEMFVEVWYRTMFSSGCVSIAWLDVQQLTLARGAPLRVVLNGAFEDKAASVTLLLTAVNFSQQAGRIVDRVTQSNAAAASSNSNSSSSGGHHRRRQQQQQQRSGGDSGAQQTPQSTATATDAPVLGIPLIAQPLPTYTTAAYTPAAVPVTHARDEPTTTQAQPQPYSVVARMRGGNDDGSDNVSCSVADAPSVWTPTPACTAAPLPPPQTRAASPRPPATNIDLPPPAYPPELYDSD